MRRVTAAAAVLAALAAGACTPAQNGTGNDLPRSDVVSGDSQVTLERRPCFGTCPVYTVVIAADGTVTFTGVQHVDTVGTATATIGDAAAAALMNELVDAGFLELDDDYTMDAKGCGPYHTDAPTVITTLRVDGRTKRIEHDHGCGGAPATLRALEERVDSVASVSRWVGGPGTRFQF
ncbi:MAG TPA: DUF6438 domain-containing protein [Longimicrobiales bacterium]